MRERHGSVEERKSFIYYFEGYGFSVLNIPFLSPPPPSTQATLLRPDLATSQDVVTISNVLCG